MPSWAARSRVPSTVTDEVEVRARCAPGSRFSSVRSAPLPYGSTTSAVGARWHRSRQLVHALVGQLSAVARQRAAQPAVKDARPVDAQQHAEARRPGRVVHVHEGVHPGCRIARRPAPTRRRPRPTCPRSPRPRPAAGRSARTRCWAGPRPVATGMPGRGRVPAAAAAVSFALPAERRDDLGHQARVEAVRSSTSCDTAPIEVVPEIASESPRRRGRSPPGQPHRDVVAGQQHLVDAREHAGLVLLDPLELGRR